MSGQNGDHNLMIEDSIEEWRRVPSVQFGVCSHMSQDTAAGVLKCQILYYPDVSDS